MAAAGGARRARSGSVALATKQPLRQCDPGRKRRRAGKQSCEQLCHQYTFRFNGGRVAACKSSYMSDCWLATVLRGEGAARTVPRGTLAKYESRLYLAGGSSACSGSVAQPPER